MKIPVLMDDKHGLYQLSTGVIEADRCGVTDLGITMEDLIE